LHIDLTRGWTESDYIISSNASKSATGIIIGIAVCLGTHLLEVLRIGARSTGTRNSIRSTAAVSICVECKAGTLAPNNRAISCLQPELLRALGVDVECTCDGTAACDALWDNRDRKVETIYIAYVIEILITCTIERELDQGCWGDSTHVVALQLHNMYRLSIELY
jgi:hypothetical protein